MKRRRKRLMVIIPFSTMTRLADNVLDVTMFYASGADEDSLEPAENAFTELLMERFEQDEDAFSIVNQSEIMEAIERDEIDSIHVHHQMFVEPSSL